MISSGPDKVAKAPINIVEFNKVTVSYVEGNKDRDGKNYKSHNEYHGII